MEVTPQVKVRKIEAVVITADGKTKKLGVVAGGNVFQRLLARVRIHFYNHTRR